MNDFSVVIQARLSSTRLPSKALLPFRGLTVLGFLLSRLLINFDKSSIFVATSTNLEDDLICDECVKYGIDYYRGSLSHVSKRLLDTALHFNLGNFIRLTADDPFIDPLESILPLFAYATANHMDFCTSYMFSPTPNGQVCSFINTSFLHQYSSVADPVFKEHIVPFFIDKFGSSCRYSPHLNYGLFPYSLAIDTVDNFRSLLNLPDSITLKTSYSDIKEFLLRMPISQFNSSFQGLRDGAYIYN